MKPCLLVFACLIFFHQKATCQYLTKKDQKEIVNFLLRNQQNKKTPAQKSTSLQQRLIAYSQTKPYNANLVWDTATLKYSGDRMSYWDDLLMYYDLTYPEYNSSFDFYFILPIGLLDNGDVWADSTQRWRRSYTTQVINLYDKMVKQFDPNNKLLSVKMHQYLAGDHMHYEHVYDTQDRLIRSYKLDIGTNDSAGIYFFEYDNAGNLVRDSQARRYNNQWIAGRSTFYTYNQNNDISAIDILSSQLDSEYHVTIIYDNLNRLFHVEIRYNYGLYWEGQYQEFFDYMGNDPEFYNRQSMEWSTGWHFYDRYFKMLNGGTTDTMQYFLYEDGFGWVKQYQTGYTYNLFGNVEQGYMTFYDLFGAEIPDALTIFTYYYEQFFPTGIRQKANLPGVISYPNPAKNLLTIKLDDVPSANNIALYNCLGQVVIDQACKSKEEDHLDVEELSPGTYYIVITDKLGLPIASGKVLKN